MKRHLMTGAAALLATLLIAAPAVARPLPTGGLTRQEMAAWLLDQGYSAEIHNDKGGVSIISSTIGPVNYDIYFNDCSGARCQTLEFLAGWTPANSITLDELNAWNATKRFVFGYRDKDLNLWVQTDIDIGSGGVWEEVTASLARWEDGATDFKGFIDRGGTLQ